MICCLSIQKIHIEYRGVILIHLGIIFIAISPVLYLEVYRVGDNRIIVNTSSLHISDQLGVRDRKRVLNTVMLIYRHDISSGLQEYLSIWTLFDSFWIFLPRPNKQRRFQLLVNGSTWTSLKIGFYWNKTTRNNSSTDVPLLRQKCENQR